VDKCAALEDYYWSDFEESKQVYLYANISYDRYIISKPFYIFYNNFGWNASYKLRYKFKD